MIDNYAILQLKAMKLFMKKVASKIGPLHSYWDYISDTEMLIKNGKSRLSFNDLRKDMYKTIWQNHKDEWIEFCKVPYIEKPYIIDAICGRKIPASLVDHPFVVKFKDHVLNASYVWNKHELNKTTEDRLNMLYRKLL